MTNKLTKKGLAFATAFAFVASALVAVAPAANAGAAGPVSLLPAAGSAYDSIRQSGFTFKSQFDTSEFESADQGTTGFWFHRNSSAQAITYKIEAPNGENLRTTMFGDPDASAARASSVPYFEAAVNTTGNFTNNGLLEAVVGYGSTGTATNNVAYIAVYRDAIDGLDSDGPANTAGNAYGEWPNIVSSGDDVVVARITAPDATTNLSLKVTVFADENYNGTPVFGEIQSAEETTTLYSDTKVSGTTVITSSMGTSITPVPVVAETTLTPATINPYMVSTSDFSVANSNVKARLYKNGDSLDIDTNADATTVSSVDKLTTTFTHTVGAGTYTARAYYAEGNVFEQWLGQLSTASGVVQGTNADVAGAYGLLEDTTSVLKVDNSNYDIKSGTKSLTFTAQISDDTNYDTEEDLAASGVRVRMTVTEQALDEDSEISVTGSTSKLTSTTGTSIVVYGVTDAKGQATFTLANSGAIDADDIDVAFSALLIDGTWSANETLDVVWDDAQVADFSSDAEALSGSSITVTYDVFDQFGGPISSDFDASEDESKPLSITIVAVDSEDQSAFDEATLSETKAVSGGKATFTFSNFATMGGHSDVEAFLHRSSDDWDDETDIENEYTEDADASVTLRIYKNDATSGLVSVKDFSTYVNLGKFYEGNVDEDAALAENLAEDGDSIMSEDGVASGNWGWGVGDNYATITGTVETTGGYGAAAQQVTISGTGLLFAFEDGSYTYYYDEILKVGTLTGFTDIDGTFEFDVYAHKVNTAGQSVTITSGGKSTTVLLKTYLNDMTLEHADFHELSWNMPKYPGLGVTAITAKATDVWGNPIPKIALEFDADEERFEDDDFVFVDGQGSSNVEKYTNSMGEAIVRVRTFTDSGRLAAPGDLDVTFYGGYIVFDGEGYTRTPEYDEDEPFDYAYDLNGDGDVSDAFEWAEYGILDVRDSVLDDNWNIWSADELRWSGFFGPQATASVGAKAGVVNVRVYNADGRKVSVKVGNKTITTTADGRVERIRVKGIKTGSRTVFVKIGKKAALTKFVSVK